MTEFFSGELLYGEFLLLIVVRMYLKVPSMAWISWISLAEMGMKKIPSTMTLFHSMMG